MSGPAPDMDWAGHPDRGCVDTPIDLWFPGRGETDSGEHVPREAAALCSHCPVRQQCLAHAIRHEPIGVWAGTSARQRKRMRRAAGIRLNLPVDNGVTETGERNPARVDAIVELYTAGVPLPDIAARFDVSVRTVHRVIADTHTPPRTWDGTAATGSRRVKAG